MKWKKDTRLRFGPFQIVCMGNMDGECEILVVYPSLKTALGAHTLVSEEVLDAIAEEAKHWTREHDPH
jgi:hypothetical protein